MRFPGGRRLLPTFGFAVWESLSNPDAYLVGGLLQR